MYKLLQETITKITTKKWSLNAAIYRLKSRFGDTTGDGCPITTRAIKAIINAELEEIKP